MANGFVVIIFRPNQILMSTTNSSVTFDMPYCKESRLMLLKEFTISDGEIKKFDTTRSRLLREK